MPMSSWPRACHLAGKHLGWAYCRSMKDAPSQAFVRSHKRSSSLLHLPFRANNIKSMICPDRRKEIPWIHGHLFIQKTSPHRLAQRRLPRGFRQAFDPLQSIQRKHFAHIHQGYWEDIGTIASFYNANIMLTVSGVALRSKRRTMALFAQITPLPGAK